MADAVSKLYAEVGFKINQQELRKAKKVLEDFAAELTKISGAAQKVIAESGKSEVKQAEANQKAILQMDKKKYQVQINNLKIYERQASNVWRNLQKIARLPFTAVEKLSRTGQSIYKYMEPSVQGAYDFENFTFESGMKLSDFQRFQRMFALSGIRMSAKDIMDDLLSVQRNLTSVALNQGGVLDAYKLTDVREAAQRNDLNGVINGIIRGLQDNRIDNSMLVKLAEMFQLGHSVEWSRLARENPQDLSSLASMMISEEERRGVVNAFKQITLTGLAFDNLRDNITAKASPFLNSFAEAARHTAEILISKIRDGQFDEVFDKMAQAGRSFLEWVESLSQEDINAFCSNVKEAGHLFIESAKTFASFMSGMAKWLHTAILTVVGAVVGSAVPGVGTVAGAAAGASVGAGWDLYNQGKNLPSEPGYDVPYFPLDTYINGTPMNDVVNSSVSSPAYHPRTVQNINNYINTVLNGLTDEEKKEKTNSMIKDVVTESVKAQDTNKAKDLNLVYVMG
jgi:hypothetical protein